MKRLQILASVLTVGALCGNLPASAQPMPAQPRAVERGPMEKEDGRARGMHGHGGPGMRSHGMPFPPGVELTEAQADRVFAIMHAQAPQRRELEKKIRTGHEALRALAASGQFDEARASSQAQALGQAAAAAALLRARTDAQLLALLTPEQRERARTPRARRMAHREENK